MVANATSRNELRSYGIALIRVVVGFTFFMHGQQKLFEQGLGGVEGFFGSLGIPAPGLAAVIVGYVETIGGLALILGLLTRLFGLLLLIDMTVAFFVFHLPNGYFVTPNVGVELVLLLGASALGLAMTGPGALAVDSRLPFWRRFAETSVAGP